MTIRECYFYDTVALELRQTRVKRFDNCTIWTAERPDGTRFILLDERARHHTTICEYDDPSEFADDLAYLTDPSGPAASGIFARPTSPPPTLAGGAARPFPPGDRD